MDIRLDHTFKQGSNLIISNFLVTSLDSNGLQCPQVLWQPNVNFTMFNRDGDREPVQTGLSIAVNQSKTGPPSKRFGFLCMLRVPGGVIKLSAPTSSLALQCLPSAMIKQPFQNLSSLVPCPLSLCSEAF